MMLKDHAETIFLKKKDPTKDFRYFLLYSFFLVFILYLSILFNSVLFATVFVEGPSMEPTLHTGDILYINKIAKAKRGDIVVINVRDNAKPYIKRVIGIEGDVIEYRQDGKLYIKKFGETQFEIILQPNTHQASGIDSWVHDGSITVGKNEVFFLGDNRLNSDDSTENGCKSTENIIGVVTKWSLKNKQTLKKIYNIFVV